MEVKTEKEDKRKPPARRSDIVIALLEERVRMLPGMESIPHMSRMYELLEELRRSLKVGKNGKNAGKEPSEDSE